MKNFITTFLAIIAASCVVYGLMNWDHARDLKEREIPLAIKCKPILERAWDAEMAIKSAKWPDKREFAIRDLKGAIAELQKMGYGSGNSKTELGSPEEERKELDRMVMVASGQSVGVLH